ncbi:MAG: PDZ domain-containing protein [Candidatus Obscuribacter sp.]|nr:PDZ domain-containing protein [Candidatus Obscuribacter sp.]
MNSKNAVILVALSSLLSMAPALAEKTEKFRVISTDFFDRKHLDIKDPQTKVNIVAEVDRLVRGLFFDKSKVNGIWLRSREELARTAAQAKSTTVLKPIINFYLSKLGTSHCLFTTDEDESFYYLESLFGSLQKKGNAKEYGVPGFVTGGTGFPEKTVRYVLAGSAADKSGIEVGDEITSVNGKTEYTYKDCLAAAGTELAITYKRQGLDKTARLKPKQMDHFKAYLKAMEDSLRTLTIEVEIGGKKREVTLTYIHMYSGGPQVRETLESLLNDKGASDALILDLRDGYGGASLTDIDCLFRNPANYPVFERRYASGAKYAQNLCFTRPVVALINSGSRSGKELLAYTLKKTGRATLVGECTAGYVVAGSFQKIDQHCALYIACADCTIDGKRLEGVGVEPDIKIPNESLHEKGYQKQLMVAIKEALRQVVKSETVDKSTREGSQ